MFEIPIVLKNPPIREAIFSISFAQAIENESFQKFVYGDFLKARFSKIAPGLAIEIKNNPIEQDIPKSIISHEYKLTRESRLLKLKTTQLSYHCLKTYIGWDSMFAELKDIWEGFCNSVGKTAIAQVSVRYINELILQPEINISEYLRLLPSIPKDFGTEIGGFLLQVSMGEKENNLTAVVTESINPKGNGQTEKTVNAILDINVFKRGPFECNADQMWNAFNDIRSYKNNIFYSIITDKTKQMYQ